MNFVGHVVKSSEAWRASLNIKSRNNLSHISVNFLALLFIEFTV